MYMIALSAPNKQIRATKTQGSFDVKVWGLWLRQRNGSTAATESESSMAVPIHE